MNIVELERILKGAKKDQIVLLTLSEESYQKLREEIASYSLVKERAQQKPRSVITFDGMTLGIFIDEDNDGKYRYV